MEDYHKDLAPLTPNQTTTTPRIPQNKPEKKSPMEEESFNCHLCKKQAGKKPWKYTKSSLQKHIEMVHEGKNPAVLSSPVVQAPATPVSYAQIVSKNIVSKENVGDKKVPKPKVSENIAVDESKSKKINEAEPRKYRRSANMSQTSGENQNPLQEVKQNSKSDRDSEKKPGLKQTNNSLKNKSATKTTKNSGKRKREVLKENTDTRVRLSLENPNLYPCLFLAYFFP